jgi:hypothetical protein
MSGRRYGPNVKNAVELMDLVARAFKLRGVIDRHRLFGLWEKIVGERLYAVCRPDKLTGDTLTVRVIDSIWANDVRMFESDILAGIAEKTGSDAVKKLRFVTAPITPKAPGPKPLPPLDSIEVETADIAGRLATPELDRHPALREKLMRLWISGRRLARLRREARPEH